MRETVCGWLTELTPNVTGCDTALGYGNTVYFFFAIVHLNEQRSARLRDESTGLLLRSHVVRQATRAGVVAARIVV